MLKVSNNTEQFNILQSKNIKTPETVITKKATNPIISGFQKDLYVKAPQKSYINPNTSVPVSEIYSPKQLLKAYLNPQYLNFLINTNPNIKDILNSKGIAIQAHPENISKISNSHLTTTTAYALQIADKMNLSQADKRVLEQACVFHDFGKVLIPKEILEKPDMLTAEEKEIMDLHSQLGYELLSNTGMNKRVLDLVKNHHNTQNNDILGQILTTADIYSALREQRSYKIPMSEKEAISILEQKADKGELNKDTVETLKSILSSSSTPYAA